MKRYIVDRIEGKYAICETEEGTMVDIELDTLPEGTAEGDVLLFDNTSYVIDAGDTEKRRRRIQKKIDNLFID